MKYSTMSGLFRRADEYELHLCQTAISWSDTQRLSSFFKIVSKLGNGVIWYVLLLAIFIFDSTENSLWLAFTGATCTLVYKILKAILVRERPFITHQSVFCSTEALDRYSFPSGHTLHAVCFCTLLLVNYPVLGLCVLPFTIAVSISRVVLGLHYPTDVAAGALIGFVIACLSISAFSPLS